MFRITHNENCSASRDVMDDLKEQYQCGLLMALCDNLRANVLDPAAMSDQQFPSAFLT